MFSKEKKLQLLFYSFAVSFVVILLFAGLVVIKAINNVTDGAVDHRKEWRKTVLSCKKEKGVPVTINGQVVCFERSAAKWSKTY